MKKKQTQNKENSAKPAQNPEQPTGAWGAPLAAAVLGFLVHLVSIRNGFVNWDDDATILNNPNLARNGAESLRRIFDIHQGSAELGNYNPLSIFSFYLEKIAAGGFSPTLIHFDNVLLHAIVVLLVARLLSAMGIGRVGAFAGALLFGIHPMRVESVAWATERKDVLFALFFFAALIRYVRWIRAGENGQQNRQGLYWSVAALMLLSCLSKVQAVALPLSMLALDYWFGRPLNVKTLVFEKIPFWALALVFGLINVYTLDLQGATDDGVLNFSGFERLCIGAWSLCVYLYKLVLPYPMLPLYNYPQPFPAWMYAAPVLFAAACFLVWNWYRNERRILVFGAVFFFVNVMFLLQIVAAGQGYLADRFTYVAYFGWFAVAAWYVDRGHADATTKTRWNAALGLTSFVFAAMTVFQIGVWKNSETLWSHVITHAGEKSGLPHWYRAQYYRSQGQFEQAMSDYQNAAKLEPKNAELINSRGKTYFDMAMSGKYPKERSAEYLRAALDDYNNSLSMGANLKPGVHGAMFINRGAALGTLNQLDQALLDFNQGLQLDPGNKTGYMNRGFLFEKMRRPEEALRDFNRYLELDPGNSRIQQEREKMRRALQSPAPTQ